jgi:hypothetical protein
MKIEISNYLRAKIIYFKIYSSKIFEGQKKSLTGPDPARGSPYADRCYRISQSTNEFALNRKTFDEMNLKIIP